MPKKKTKQKYDIDEEIIIGYNTKGKKDKPPQKKNKKKKKKKNKWSKIKKVLLAIIKIILILAVLAGIGVFLFVSPVFNITEIKVENAEKISKNTYIVLSKIEIGQNIFRISKSKVRDSIKTESYVENIEVKREYPGTIVLTVTERKPEYMLEYNGIYVYVDKNGYILERNPEALKVPILRGIHTNLENVKLGQRLDEEDLSKFNDLIKIINGLTNKNVTQKLTSIDITDDNNYILEFTETGKKVLIGDTSDLSTKMLWIKHFMENETEREGIIHLVDIKNIYFEPKRD